MHIDLTASRPDLYAPSARQVSEIVVPAMTFAVLRADGTLDQRAAMQQLVAFSTIVRNLSASELRRPYVLCPLERLTEDARSRRDSSSRGWTLMVRQPDWLPHLTWDLARMLAADDPSIHAPIQVRQVDEGRALQLLSCGAQRQTESTIARLLADPDAGQDDANEATVHEVFVTRSRFSPSDRRTVVRRAIASGGGRATLPTPSAESWTPAR